MNYVMGIDLGGTFSKAAIFDEDGRQISAASKATRTLTPRPGYTERDMKELWQVNARVIREALEQSGVAPAQIAAVSFSGHGKGLYLTDEMGQPVYPGILSTDNRAWEIVARWRSDGTAQKAYALSLQQVLPCQPVSLMAWLKENEPQVLERTRYIFSVKDYLRFCLTGQAWADYTDFSGGSLLNLHTGTYDRDLLALFGIAELYEKLPPLCHSHEQCGQVTKEAAALTGLCAGTPVAAGMFDVNACGIASGLTDVSRLCMIAGTWSINEFISREPVTNQTVDLNSMFCMPGYYLVEESSPTSAGNMEWFLRNLMDREADLEGDPYELANRWVEEIAPQDCDLIFLPFLNGSNENPLARGTFTGLTAYHTKKHMLRAVYEGVVFSHMTHVKRLLQNRTAPDSLRLSGGAARSDVWVQIFADAFALPIDLVEEKELGAQGAAMAAGICAGLYRDYPDAARKTVRITRQVLPRPAYQEVYQKKYEQYRLLIEALDHVWNPLYGRSVC